jgi:hypothetical protein
VKQKRDYGAIRRFALAKVCGVAPIMALSEEEFRIGDESCAVANGVSDKVASDLLGVTKFIVTNFSSGSGELAAII